MEAAAACRCPPVAVKCATRKKKKSLDFVKLQKVLGPSSLNWFDTLSKKAENRQDQEVTTPQHPTLDNPCFHRQQLELLQAATPGLGSLTPLSAWALLSSQDPNTSTPSTSDHPIIASRSDILSPPDVEPCLKTCQGIAERLGLPTDDTNLSWTNSMATPGLGGDAHLSQEAEAVSTPAPKPKGFPRALFSPDQGRGDSEDMVKELSVTLDEDGLSQSQIPATPPARPDLRRNMMKELFLKSSGQTWDNQVLSQNLQKDAEENVALSPVAASASRKQSPVTPQGQGRRMLRNMKKSLVQSPLVYNKTNVQYMQQSRIDSQQKEEQHETVFDVDEDVQLKINILRTAACFDGSTSDRNTHWSNQKAFCSDTEVDSCIKLSGKASNKMTEDVSFSDSTEHLTSTSPVLNRKVRNKLTHSQTSNNSSNVKTCTLVNQVLADFMDSPSSVQSRRRSPPKKGQKRKSADGASQEDRALLSTPSPLESQTTRLQSILSSSKRRKHGSSRKRVRFAEKLCQKEGEVPAVAKKLEYLKSSMMDNESSVNTVECCEQEHKEKECDPPDNKSEETSNQRTHDINVETKLFSQLICETHVDETHVDQNLNLPKIVISTDPVSEDPNCKMLDGEEILFEPEDIVIEGKLDIRSLNSKDDSSRCTLRSSENSERVTLVVGQVPDETVLEIGTSEASTHASTKEETNATNDLPVTETHLSIKAASVDEEIALTNKINSESSVQEHILSSPIRPKPTDEVFSQVSPSSLTEMCLVANSDPAEIIEKEVPSLNETLPQVNQPDGNSGMKGCEKTLQDEYPTVQISADICHEAKVKDLLPGIKDDKKSAVLDETDTCVQSDSNDSSSTTADCKPDLQLEKSESDREKVKREVSSVTESNNSSARSSCLKNFLTKKPKPKKFFYPTSFQIKAVCPKTVFNFRESDCDSKVESDTEHSKNKDTVISQIDSKDAESLLDLKRDVDTNCESDLVGIEDRGNPSHMKVVLEDPVASTASPPGAEVESQGQEKLGDPEDTHRTGSKINTQSQYFNMGFVKFSEMFDDNMDDDFEAPEEDSTVVSEEVPVSKCDAVRETVSIEHEDISTIVEVNNQVSSTVFEASEYGPHMAEVSVAHDSAKGGVDVKNWMPNTQDVHNMVEEVQEELFTDIEFSQVEVDAQIPSEDLMCPQHSSGSTDTSGDYVNETDSRPKQGEVNSEFQIEGEKYFSVLDTRPVNSETDGNKSASSAHDDLVFKMPDVPGKNNVQKACLSDSDTDLLLSDMDLSGQSVSENSSPKQIPSKLVSEGSDFKTCVSETDSDSARILRENNKGAESAVSSVSNSDTENYVTSTEEEKDISPKEKKTASRHKIPPKSRSSRKPSAFLSSSQKISDSDSDVNPVGRQVTRKRKTGVVKHFGTIKEPIVVSETNPLVVWSGLDSATIQVSNVSDEPEVEEVKSREGKMSSEKLRVADPVFVLGKKNTNESNSNIQPPDFVGLKLEEVKIESDCKREDPTLVLENTILIQPHVSVQVTADSVMECPAVDNRNRESLPEKVSRVCSVSDWSDMEPGEADEADEEVVFAASEKSARKMDLDNGQELEVEVTMREAVKEHMPEEAGVKEQKLHQDTDQNDQTETEMSLKHTNLPEESNTYDKLDSRSSTFQFCKVDNIQPESDNLNSRRTQASMIPTESSKPQILDEMKLQCQVTSFPSKFSGFSTAGGMKINLDANSLKKASALFEPENELDPMILSIEKAATTDQALTGFSTASGKKVSLDAKAVQKATALFEKEESFSLTEAPAVQVPFSDRCGSLQRQKGCMDIPEMTASSLKGFNQDGFPSFSTASGKNLVLHGDALSKVQIMMESVDDPTLDKKLLEKKVCDRPSSCTEKSESVINEDELESMLDDLLKSKRKCIEQSKHGEMEKSEFVNVSSKFQDGFKVSSNIRKDNIDRSLNSKFDKSSLSINSPSMPGFSSSADKKPFHTINSKGKMKSDPMLKPKGFRPFKKPRIVQKPKPVESDMTVDASPVDKVLENSAVSIGGAGAIVSGHSLSDTSGREASPGAPTQLKPDSNMSEMLLQEFSTDMMEVSQSWNKAGDADNRTKAEKSSINPQVSNIAATHCDDFSQRNLQTVYQEKPHSPTKRDSAHQIALGPASFDSTNVSSIALQSEKTVIADQYNRPGNEMCTSSAKSEAHLKLMDVLFEGDMSSQLDVRPGRTVSDTCLDITKVTESKTTRLLQKNRFKQSDHVVPSNELKSINPNLNVGVQDTTDHGAQVLSTEARKSVSTDSLCKASDLFQTASGRRVSVSNKAMTEARKIWEKTPVGENKSQLQSSVSLFQTASGKEVKVSPASVAEARKVLDDAEKHVSINPSSFQTAGGTSVSLSADALEKSKQLFESEGSLGLPLFCERGSRDSADQVDQAVVHQGGYESALKSTASPFQTASGLSVTVSSKALCKARKLISDDELTKSSILTESVPTSIVCNSNGETKVQDSINSFNSHFQTASGNSMTVSANSLARGKTLWDDDVDNKRTSSSDIFQITSGASGNVSAKSQTQDRSVGNDDIVPPPTCSVSNPFQTASGTTVTVSSKALAQGKKLWNDESYQIPKSTDCDFFKTASGADVNVSDQALAQGRKLWTTDSAEKSCSLSLFQTASGASVNVSDQALAQGKKLWTDESDQISKSDSLNLFQTASGAAVQVSSKALAQGKKLFAEDNEPTIKQGSHSLFQTASGASVSVSSKALAQGKMLWADENNQTANLTNLNLFQTASGTSVSVSSKSLARGKKLYADLSDQSTQSTSHSLFQTASGSSVTVSSEALANSRKLLTDASKEPPASRSVEKSGLLMLDTHKQTDEEMDVAVVPKGLQVEGTQKTSCEKDCEKADVSKINEGNHGDSPRTPLLSTPEAVFLDHGCQGGRRFQPVRSTSLAPARSEEYTLEAVTRKSGLSVPQTTSSNFKTPYKNTAFVTPVRRPEDKQKSGKHEGKTPVFFPRAALRTNQNISRKNLTNQKFSGSGLTGQNSDMSSSYHRQTNQNSCNRLSSEHDCRTSVTGDKTGRCSPSVVNSENISGTLSKTDTKTSQDGLTNDSVDRTMKPCSAKHPMGGTTDQSKKSTQVLRECLSEIQNVPMNSGMKCHLEDARRRQGEIIQRKKKLKIRPCVGRLLNEKSASQQRMQYRDFHREGSFSEEELQSLGVRPETYDVSSSCAEEFRFFLRRFYPHLGSSVLVGDGAELIPDNSGFAGKEEFYKSFLTLEGVDPKLTSDLWVYNHYRWIVWKMAAYEVALPKQFGGRCLTPDNVMLQLKYRYDREVDRCHRSALKKIVERDDAACKRMVLCVADIRCCPCPTGDSSASSEKVLELTDGWYSVKARLDVGLTELVQRKKISVGQKICLSGAELTGCQDACTPLEIPESLYLKICMNSTRPAPWDCRLGYQRDPRPLCVPITSLHAEGGVVGCIDAVVTRVYPVMYMEKIAEGGTVFRTEEEEERVQRQFEQQKQDKMEKLYTKLQMGLEQEGGQGQRKSRKRWTQSEVEELQTGQEIYDAVEGSLQPDELQCWLSQYQLQQLEDHQRRLQEQRQQQLQDKLQRAWEDAQQGPSSRSVTPVLKMRLAGCAKRDIDAKTSTIVTVWRPTAEWLSLHEGKRYKMFGLTATTARTRLESGSVHLTAARHTRLQQLPVDENYLDLLYEPREVWTVKDLRSRSPPSREFDFVGIVVSHQTDSPRNCDTVIAADTEGDTLNLRFWGRMLSFGVEEQLSVGKCFVASNLILKMLQGAVTADACHEVSRFSASSKNPDHRKSLARFTAMPKAEKNKLIEAAKSSLSNHGNRTPALPRQLMTTPEKFFSDLPSECLQRLFSPMEEATATKGDNPVTPDPVLRKRRAVLRERSSKLMAYGSPKPLSPLTVQVSPAVARGFKSPFNPVKTNKDSSS